MSWHYLQEQAEASWAGSCLAGAPSALLSLIPTAEASCLPDSATESSIRSRYGMTCAVSTEPNGAGTSMLSAGDSLAKTFPPQEKAQESTASDPACGEKWQGSFARYDPATHSWRTHQHSLLGGFTEFSETWPRWGSMRNGECWERTTAVPPTSASESGLWQTPVAYDAVDREKGKWNSRGEPKLSAQVLKWPTPRASDGEKGGPNQRGSKGDLTLPSAVMKWPTPTVCGNYNRKGVSATSGDGLATVVARFPTPTATQHKGWAANHNRANTDDRLDYTIEREAANTAQPGRLNPTWVEWLMGWPSEWTDLKPLGMDKYQEWQREHGCC